MELMASIPSPPPRPLAGHKGSFGTVVVVGGSPLMPGAAALTARAAFRAGAGRVKVATDPAVLPTVLAIEPGATGVAWATGATGAAAAADLPADAVYAIGPGWGPGRGPGWGPGQGPGGERAWVPPIPKGVRRVVDADGLNRLASAWADGLSGPVFDGPTVLTPHPGEFRRLAEALGLDADPVDPGRRPAAAQRLAEATGAVVLLKGHETVVYDPASGRGYLNRSGTPALAVAGTGDVLTGLIAGLMAQGMAAFDAARLGAFAHGLAGEAWAAAHGPAGLRAVELADRLPITLHGIRNTASA